LTRQFMPGKRQSFPPARTDQQAPRVCLFTRKTEQTQLALGIRTCSRHDERRYALRLLNAVLGENMSSRLFQVIREDRGLAYSIYSTPSFFADTGDLVISAGCDTGKIQQTLTLAMRELRRLKEELVNRAELNRARDYVLGQIDLGQESTENQMNWVGEQMLGYSQVPTPAQIKNRLSQVSAAQIRAAARDFFTPGRISLAAVSPIKRSKGLRPALRL